MFKFLKNIFKPNRIPFVPNPEPETLFIVKVISHNKDYPWQGDYWWSKHIGEEFEIIAETEKYYKTKYKHYHGLGIRKTDAIKIND